MNDLALLKASLDKGVYELITRHLNLDTVAYETKLLLKEIGLSFIKGNHNKIPLVNFYDTLSGTLAPVSPVKVTYPILNFSVVTVTALNNYSIDNLTNVNSLNFSYEAQIIPVFTIDENSAGANTLQEKICGYV